MIIKRINLDEKFDNVYLDAYIADETENFKRNAILVIPGGGYKVICNDREGEPVALSFMAQGYNAFVLRYSVDGQKVFPGQLIEASLAMKHIKDNAEEYGINPEKVFVTGFSAGGHLAASLGILWHKKEIYEACDMPFGYNKPSGMMLGYPVISFNDEFGHVPSGCYLFGTDNLTDEQVYEGSLENHVDENSVPLFVMHTADDQVVDVRNALALANAYANAGKKFEMHIYPSMPHGAALANKITSCGRKEWENKQIERWIADAAAWAEEI